MKIQNKLIWKMTSAYVISNICLIYANIRYYEEKDNFNKKKTRHMSCAEFALRMI